MGSVNDRWLDLELDPVKLNSDPQFCFLAEKGVEKRAHNKFSGFVPILSYKVTHIFTPSGFLGSTCNSNPLTFSVWFCATSPIRGALGPGQGGSSAGGHLSALSSDVKYVCS